MNDNIYITVTPSDLDKIIAALCGKIESSETLMRYHATENARLLAENETMKAMLKEAGNNE